MKAEDRKRLIEIKDELVQMANYYRPVGVALHSVDSHDLEELTLGIHYLLEGKGFSVELTK